MKGTIKEIFIMNTICEYCYEKHRELQILIIRETVNNKLIYNLVCAECSTKFKVGDEIE